MEYPCEVVERQAQPVLSIRTRVAVQNLPETVGKGYMAIAQHLESLGKAPQGVPFIIYYNMDMDDLDLEMGFPVSGDITGAGEILKGEIPAGRYATCTHTGPYNELNLAYKALTGWVRESGYEASGLAVEFYLNSQDTPPQELQTQILFPIIS
jgi:effector-binding domain-containing protein